VIRLRLQPLVSFILMIFTFGLVVKGYSMELLSTNGLHIDGVATFSVRPIFLDGDGWNQWMIQQTVYLLTNTSDPDNLRAQLYPRSFFDIPGPKQAMDHDLTFLAIKNRLFVTSVGEPFILIYSIDDQAHLNFVSRLTVPAGHAEPCIWHGNQKTWILTIDGVGRRNDIKIAQLGTIPDEGPKSTEVDTGDDDAVRMERLLRQYGEGELGGYGYLSLVRLIHIASYLDYDWDRIDKCMRNLVTVNAWSHDDSYRFQIGKWFFVESLATWQGREFNLKCFNLESPLTPMDPSMVVDSGDFKSFRLSADVERLTDDTFLCGGWDFIRLLPDGKIAHWKQSDNGAAFGGGGDYFPFSVFGCSTNQDLVYSAVPSTGFKFDRTAGTVDISARYTVPNQVLASIIDRRDIDQLKRLYALVHDQYHYRERIFYDVKERLVKTNDLTFVTAAFDSIFGDLENWRSDPKELNDRPYNPLPECVRQNNLDLLRFFLQKAPHLALLATSTSEDPFLVAATTDNIEACKVLVSAGTVPRSFGLGWTDRGGITSPGNALTLAVSQTMKNYLIGIGVPTQESLKNNQRRPGLVRDKSVRLRSEPTLKGSMIRVLRMQEQLEIVGFSAVVETINGESGQWIQVKDSQGKTGWMWGKYFALRRGEN